MPDIAIALPAVPVVPSPQAAPAVANTVSKGADKSPGAESTGGSADTAEETRDFSNTLSEYEKPADQAEPADSTEDTPSDPAGVAVTPAASAPPVPLSTEPMLPLDSFALLASSTPSPNEVLPVVSPALPAAAVQPALPSEDLSALMPAAVQPAAIQVQAPLPASFMAPQEPVLGEAASTSAQTPMPQGQPLTEAMDALMQMLQDHYPELLSLVEEASASADYAGLQKLLARIAQAVGAPSPVADTTPVVAEEMQLQDTPQDGPLIIQALLNRIKALTKPVDPVSTKLPTEHTALTTPQKSDYAPPPVLQGQVVVQPLADNAAPQQGQANLASTKTDAASPVVLAGNAQEQGQEQQTGGNSGGGNNGGQAPAAALTAQNAPHASQDAAAKTDGAFQRMLTEHYPSPAEQISFHMKAAVREGTSRIHIQLDPVELGRIEIRLEVAADGKTGATITADSRQTMEMLQREVRGLERALADAGLKADTGSLNFNLRGDQGQQHSGQQSYREQNEYMAQEVDSLEEELLLAPLRAYQLQPSEGLNIHV